MVPASIEFSPAHSPEKVKITKGHNGSANRIFSRFRTRLNQFTRVFLQKTLFLMSQLRWVECRTVIMNGTLKQNEFNNIQANLFLLGFAVFPYLWGHFFLYLRF